MIRNFILAVLVGVTGCSLARLNVKEGREVNVAFVAARNQLQLPSVTVDGKQGRYLLATANDVSVVDPAFARLLSSPGRVSVVFGGRDASTVKPAVEDLQGLGDALIASDSWGRDAVAIDYRRGLVSITESGYAHTEGMVHYKYHDVPAVTLNVDGHDVPGIVDTLIPDTLVIPRRLAGGRAERKTVDIILGGRRFDHVDARVADVPDVRIGNRLLAKFLVTIDYGKREVALWPDERTDFVPAEGH